MSLTAEQRRAIRFARDQLVRAMPTQAATCGGCGGDRNGYTLGCDTCRKRRRRRMVRAAELRVSAAVGECVGVDRDEQVRFVLSAIPFPRDPPGRKPGAGNLPRPAKHTSAV